MLEFLIEVAPGVACLLLWLHSLGELERMREKVRDLADEIESLREHVGLLPEEVDE